MHTHTLPHRRAEINETFHDLHCCLYTVQTLLFPVPSTSLANTPTIHHPHLNPPVRLAVAGSNHLWNYYSVTEAVKTGRLLFCVLQMSENHLLSE